MQKKLRLPPRKVSLAINQLPHDSNSQEVRLLAQGNSSYLLIPGYPLTTTIDIEPLIIALLPLSLHQLIDIGLPFLHPSRLTRIPARYLLFQGKLAAIRICQCPEWPIDKIEWISPFPALQQAYRFSKITFTPLEIPVGCFYLQLSNCRMGFLFEQELTANPNLLKLYDRYKCDILSVSSSSQENVVREGSRFRTVIESEPMGRLKQLARQQGIALIVGGVKMVPSLSNIFWQKSFIMQGTRCKTETATVVGDMNRVTFVADLGLALSRKWETNFDEGDTLEEEPWLEKVEICAWLQNREEEVNQEARQPENKKTISELATLKEATLYNLHYIFRTVNEGSPFVLAYPLTSKSQQLLTHLILLQEHSRVELEQLIAIYSTVSDFPISISQVPVFSSFSTMLAANHRIKDIVYLYCDDCAEVKKLRESHGGRICNCDALTPFVSDSEPNPQGPQGKNIEAACVHVLKARHQSLEEMLAYFLNIGLQKKEIEKCFTEVLPGKVKMFMKLTPHYIFLLHSQADRILEAIGEAEIRLKSREREGAADAAKTEMVEEVNRLTEKIEAARAFKSKQSQYISCHRCQYHFKKDLTYCCPDCKKGICFHCLDVLTSHTLFDLSHYKCYLCLGMCPCKQCHPDSSLPISSAIQGSSPPEIDPTFNLPAFECSRCQILSDNYDLIRIECQQCKSLKCYNCARMSPNLDKKNLEQWLCDECLHFNWQINHPEQKTLEQKMDVSKDIELLQQTPEEKPSPKVNNIVIDSSEDSATPPLRQEPSTPQISPSKESSPLWSRGKEINPTSNYSHFKSKPTKQERPRTDLWKKHSPKEQKKKFIDKKKKRQFKSRNWREDRPIEKEDRHQNRNDNRDNRGLIFQTKDIPADPESFSY